MLELKIYQTQEPRIIYWRMLWIIHSCLDQSPAKVFWLLDCKVFEMWMEILREENSKKQREKVWWMIMVGRSSWSNSLYSHQTFDDLFNFKNLSTWMMNQFYLFSLYRQQALFHVLAAYSMYNVVGFNVFKIIFDADELSKNQLFQMIQRVWVMVKVGVRVGG